MCPNEMVEQDVQRMCYKRLQCSESVYHVQTFGAFSIWFCEILKRAVGCVFAIDRHVFYFVIMISWHCLILSCFLKVLHRHLIKQSQKLQREWEASLVTFPFSTQKRERYRDWDWIVRNCCIWIWLSHIELSVMVVLFVLNYFGCSLCNLLLFFLQSTEKCFGDTFRFWTNITIDFTYITKAKITEHHSSKW